MRKGFDQKRKQELSRRKNGLARRTAQHPWVKCQSGKVSYTWHEADLNAAVSGMYFYRCPRCRDYHLTEDRQKKPPQP